jgi:hypothetical protein
MPIRINCSILAITAGSDGMTPPNFGVVLNLKDLGGTFNDVEFGAAAVGAREILAVALTAISTGSKTGAAIDDPTGVQNPICYNLSIVT